MAFNRSGALVVGVADGAILALEVVEVAVDWEWFAAWPHPTATATTSGPTAPAATVTFPRLTSRRPSDRAARSAMIGMIWRSAHGCGRWPGRDLCRSKRKSNVTFSSEVENAGKVA
jgi:hypothetical protein